MKKNNFDDNWLTSELQDSSLEDDGFSTLVIKQVNQYEHKNARKWGLALSALCISAVLVTFFHFDGTNFLDISAYLENSDSLNLYIPFSELEVLGLLIVVLSMGLIWLTEELL